RVAGEKGPEPVACLAAVALHERLHALQLRCAAGDDLQLGFEAAQIQLRDEAVVALLDQEAARSWLQALPDEPIFALGEAEALRIVLPARFWIGEKDLRRSLLDDGATDGTLQHVARALRCEAHDPIELAPGLGTVLDEGRKGLVGQQAQELIHPAHQSSAIELLSH